MADKPRVLILGGVGFVGRNLVEYLLEKDLVSHIRVADKVLPELGNMNDKQNGLFKSDKVDFKQANLAREAMVTKAFDDSDGKFDFVFNLAAETKLSQTDEVYKENVIDIVDACAKIAAQHGVKRWVELSTAQVYDAGKKPSNESSAVKPWTKLAKAKFAAEEHLRSVDGLDVIFVRPANIYGPGDMYSITPRAICGAVYKKLDEKMKFLWEKDLKMNTVHVSDVVAALWHLTTNGNKGDVFNLSDKSDTNQGTVSAILESVYGIKTGFMGNMKSKVATSVAMKTVTENVNEKHLKPWSDLCKANGITNTPLTPYLDEELLYNNNFSIDGSKIEGSGFAYAHPQINEDLIRQSIQYHVDIGIFPKGMMA